ncbi:MAG TPA: hypothetical protein VFQ85_15155 [Mycobacteriales bacterium]|jgi:plastocyanin|nr:hypothetical protein [Mycobacteriales bacterium]
MPRISKTGRTAPDATIDQAAAVPDARDPDVLEVIHHTIPENAAAAGAPPIPAATGATGTTAEATTAPATDTPAGTTAGAAGYLGISGATTVAGTGMTWRRMLRDVAIAEVAGFVALMAAGMAFDMQFFPPVAIAILLFGGAIAWLRRGSKASAVYTLVVSSLTLLVFGGLFFGWTGFTQPRSWFEMGFATLSVLVPLAGVVAGIAVLRHRDGTDAARTPSRVVAAIAGLVVLTGVVGAATASDATPLPGDSTLVAHNFEFEQKAITAKSGDVPIYFRNNDTFAHNVRIDGHGTSQNGAGRQAIRHVFHGMTAGAYTIYCNIHPDMKVALTVT